MSESDQTHSLKSFYIRELDELVEADYGFSASHGVQFGYISSPVSIEIGDPINVRRREMQTRPFQVPGVPASYDGEA